MHRTYHDLIAWQRAVGLAKETQLTIAEELEFIGDASPARASIDQLFGLLNGLINSLKRPRSDR